MKLSLVLKLFTLVIVFSACESDGYKKVVPNKSANYKMFSGNYHTTFNDLPDLHNNAASKQGVGPFASRSDTSVYEKKIVKSESLTPSYLRLSQAQRNLKNNR